jgi:hypothetical protein
VAAGGGFEFRPLMSGRYAVCVDRKLYPLSVRVGEETVLDLTGE